MNKSINFTKMHGLGNDFILVEGEDITKNNLQYSTFAKEICDRRFGIGADGLIIVNPTDVECDTDTSWRIFNSDGSEPQMCGNGIRCFAKYVYNKNIVKAKKFTVWTLAGVITPEIQDNEEVRVNMGEPSLETSKIPASVEELDCLINYPLEIEDRIFNITTVSMGNPHCIIFTEEDSEKLAKEYGPKIEKHEIFPEKINVEFVKIISKNNIKIDVWERGCGITLACGTGACASVVASVLNNLTENIVTADLPGGSLKIEWSKDNNTNSFKEIYMTGKSNFVFEGKYLLSK